MKNLALPQSLDLTYPKIARYIYVSSPNKREKRKLQRGIRINR